jgi:putative ABC transport system ATP-binding protein
VFVIEVRNVTKSHWRGENEIRALRGITCEISSGSFNFIVGPSGSGKSTLLHLIGALDRSTTGEILVDGRVLSNMTTHECDDYRRQRVGFVFQNFNLLGNLDAVDNVLAPYVPLGVSRDLRRRAVDVLKRVGLAARLDHRPGQLSGGEQQRVAIARAILKQPALILADEPTGELDSRTGAEVFGYLRTLHREHNTTVIVVTH